MSYFHLFGKLGPSTATGGDFWAGGAGRLRIGSRGLGVRGLEWFGVEFLQKLESEGPSWSLIGGLGDPVGSKLKVREVKLALSWWLWSPRGPQVEPNTGPGVPKLGSRVQNLGPGAPKLDPKGDPKGVKMRPKRWQKVIQRGTRAPKNYCLH